MAHSAANAPMIAPTAPIALNHHPNSVHHGFSVEIGVGFGNFSRESTQPLRLSPMVSSAF